MKTTFRPVQLCVPRSYLRPAAVLLGSALLCGGGAAARSAQPTSEITVTVTNLRSGEGVVRACITARQKDFYKCDAANSVLIVTPAAAEGVKISFPGVAPGRYAIALLHDANNNGKADRSLFMIPTEGFGFSRDAKVRLGPPAFEAAAFEVTGKPLSQTIRMRYML